MSFINKFIDKAKGSRQQNQPDNNNHTPQNSNHSSSNKSVSSIATTSTNHSVATSSHQTDFSTLKNSSSSANHSNNKQDEDLEGKVLLCVYPLQFFLSLPPSSSFSIFLLLKILFQLLIYIIRFD